MLLYVAPGAGHDSLPVEEVPDGAARLQNPAEAGCEELLAGYLQTTLAAGAEVVIERKIQVRLLLQKVNVGDANLFLLRLPLTLTKSPGGHLCMFEMILCQ